MNFFLHLDKKTKDGLFIKPVSEMKDEILKMREDSPPPPPPSGGESPPRGDSVKSFKDESVRL